MSFRKNIFLLMLALVASMPMRAADPVPAGTLFARAQDEAARQNKQILLVFSASWCGPCKLYERFLEDPQMKPLIEKAFVVVRIDVGEQPRDNKHSNTPGGEVLRYSLGADKEPGYPWIVITDTSGKPVVDSYIRGNTMANIGYPASPEEIDWYVEMLRHSSLLSDADRTQVQDWLHQHSPHH